MTLRLESGIWETAVADPKLGESVPAAPIAWDGLVFAGNASGDAEGGKGRVYALEIDWCTTVSLQTNPATPRPLPGHTWFGIRRATRFICSADKIGATKVWAGWISAVDADSGVWKLRLEVQLPDRGRGDADRRRRRDVRRCWRQRRKRQEVVGPEDRRRDRRWRPPSHMWLAADKRSSWQLALRNVDMPTAVTTSKDRRAGHRQRLLDLLRHKRRERLMDSCDQVEQPPVSHVA